LIRPETHLLGRPLVGVAFSVGGGHQARLFAGMSIPVDLPKTDILLIVHAIDADLLATV